MKSETLVIALGGNAITRPQDEGTIPEQFNRTAECMALVAELVGRGFGRILISHGNGPQVGNIVLRSELAEKILYGLPLDTCVSDSQGGMGYMIQQVLRNALARRGIRKDIATLVTQTLVDRKDPAFERPSKPVGRFFSKEEAAVKTAESGWNMKEDANRGWRRVVPSPRPIEIIEKDVISQLLDAGAVVVAVGGGGIPVYKDKDGSIRGVEAVVDKDMATALVAASLKAETLIILTSVPCVAISFGKPGQKDLREVTASEMERHLDAGEFAPGSMKPKIEAALFFLRNGGRRVLITLPENLVAAMEGRTGTVIKK